MSVELAYIQQIKNDRYTNTELANIYIPKSESILAHSVVSEGITILIDASVSTSHSITVTEALTLNITGLTVGKRSGVMLDIKNGGSFAITFTGGTFNWIGVGGVFQTSLALANVTLKNDGSSDFMILWSDDGINIFGKVIR